MTQSRTTASKRRMRGMKSRITGSKHPVRRILHPADNGALTVKNRSFINRAVILAAGKGTRMGGATRDLPKPLLEIKGRPMLAHILERLAASGVERFLIVTGFRHELIEEQFRDWPLPVEFRLQQPVNGTASAALLAEEFAAGEPFLVTFADILCAAAEYAHCAQVLLENSGASAVVAVKAVEDPWQGAAVYEENRRIRRIVEKPPRGTSQTCWNSAGFYAFQPVVFKYLARVQPSTRNEYELTSALALMLKDGLELRISSIEGEWRDVGRPEDLAVLNSPADSQY